MGVFDKIFVRRLATAAEVEIDDPGVSDLFRIDLVVIAIDENVEELLAVEVLILGQMDRRIIARNTLIFLVALDLAVELLMLLNIRKRIERLSRRRAGHSTASRLIWMRTRCALTMSSMVDILSRHRRRLRLAVAGGTLLSGRDNRYGAKLTSSGNVRSASVVYADNNGVAGKVCQGGGCRIQLWACG